MRTRLRAVVLGVAVVLAALVGILGAVLFSGSDEPETESRPREPRMQQMQLSGLPSVLDGQVVTAAGLSGGGLVALGTADGRVSMTDESLQPWRGGWERRAGGAPITHLAFSLDGTALAAATDGSFWVWRLDTEEENVIPATGVPSAFALSADGRLLAATSFDIYVFDVAAGSLVASFVQEVPEGGAGEYEAVAFTPDSGTVVAASLAGIDAWSLETRTRAQPSCECPGGGSTLSRDAALATFGTGDAHVLLWDVASAKLVADETISVVMGDHVYGTATSLDGAHVLAGTASGQIVAWAPGSDRRLGPIEPSGEPIVRIEASNDGRLFLVEGQKADFSAEPGERDRWLVRISGG